MRASTARLMNSPVRLADLTFPQVNRLIHRTRLAFIHLDNLLAFGKRDRDGRVDGYITAHLPDECLLVFFRKGEAVNAASLHPSGRHVVTITEALKRMRAEVERGDLAYCAAPMEQLAWMYQSCDVPLQPRAVDAGSPGALFPAVAELPQQAPNALINTYRELYWRIVDEVEKEFPGEAKRRAQKVSAGILEQHKAIGILSAPRGTETPDAVVQPEELAAALMDWSRQLLQGVEVIMPGTAPKILREATREHRYVLQSAGFYGQLPW